MTTTIKALRTISGNKYSTGGDGSVKSIIDGDVVFKVNLDDGSTILIFSHAIESIEIEVK